MINVEKLKKKILDIAVTGKLTEHLPSDGNAQELIALIESKKKELIKSKQLKIDKELKSIEAEDMPYEIPESWTWIRLGNYAQKVTDQVASGSFASLRDNVVSLKDPDYALMVKTADFGNGFTKNLTYTNKHGYEFLNNSNLFGGELILSNIGSIGKVFIVPKLNIKMTLAPNSVMIRLTDDSLIMYLYYFLLSNYGYKELDEISTGIAMKKFNKGGLKTILVPIPPLEEQKRIVAKLDEIFGELDRIDADQNKLVTLQDKLEDKLLGLAIQGKLVEQRPEEGTGDELLNKLGKKVIDYAQTEDLPFDIPNSWVWCKLSDIGSTNIGLTYHPQDVVDKGTLVIRSSNIVDGKMDYTDKVCVNCQIKENQYVKNNDIVICSRNGSKRLVGKNAIYKGESNKYAFGAFMAIFRTEFYDFVHLYFNTNAFKRYFETDDSKQINQVTQALLKDSLIPLPPYEEQKRIVAKLNELLPQVKSM